jgi:hypothetical protein
MFDEALRLGAVRIEQNALSEMKDDRVPLTVVPRDDVLTVELVRASESARPRLQAGFGILLIAIGLIPLYELAAWWAPPAMGSAKVCLLPWAALVGAMVCYDALKRVPLLRVQTPRGVKKLAFRVKADNATLESFREQAEQLYGYAITSKL